MMDCEYFDTTRNGNHSSFWHYNLPEVAAEFPDVDVEGCSVAAVDWGDTALWTGVRLLSAAFWWLGSNKIYGCFATMCFFRLDVDPPWIDRWFLHMLHLTDVLEISVKYSQMALRFSSFLRSALGCDMLNRRSIQVTFTKIHCIGYTDHRRHRTEYRVTKLNRGPVENWVRIQ